MRQTPQTLSPGATAVRPETHLQRGRRHLRQFIKFGIVGGSGIVVNMAITFVMTKMHGGTRRDNEVLFPLWGEHAFRWTVLVWIVAFLVANLWNFQLNRSWTFKRLHRRSWWAEFWPFFAVGAVAAAAGAFIKVALTNSTSPIYLPSPVFNDHQGLRARAYWAQLITIVLTMPINFLVNKVWTFRVIKHHPGTPAEDLSLVAPVVAPEVSVDERTQTSAE